MNFIIPLWTFGFWKTCKRAALLVCRLDHFTPVRDPDDGLCKLRIAVGIYLIDIFVNLVNIFMLSALSGQSQCKSLCNLFSRVRLSIGGSYAAVILKKVA